MTINNFTKRLASHPKLLHILFVSLIVLTQVGIVVADNNGTGTGGP